MKLQNDRSQLLSIVDIGSTRLAFTHEDIIVIESVSQIDHTYQHDNISTGIGCIEFAHQRLPVYAFNEQLTALTSVQSQAKYCLGLHAKESQLPFALLIDRIDNSVHVKQIHYTDTPVFMPETRQLFTQLANYQNTLVLTCDAERLWQRIEHLQNLQLSLTEATAEG